jgi:hypothetical protein
MDHENPTIFWIVSLPQIQPRVQLLQDEKGTRTTFDVCFGIEYEFGKQSSSQVTACFQQISEPVLLCTMGAAIVFTSHNANISPGDQSTMQDR